MRTVFRVHQSTHREAQVLRPRTRPTLGPLAAGAGEVCTERAAARRSVALREQPVWRRRSCWPPAWWHSSSKCRCSLSARLTCEYIDLDWGQLGPVKNDQRDVVRKSDRFFMALSFGVSICKAGFGLGRRGSQCSAD